MTEAAERLHYPDWPELAQPGPEGQAARLSYRRDRGWPETAKPGDRRPGTYGSAAQLLPPLSEARGEHLRPVPAAQAGPVPAAVAVTAEQRQAEAEAEQRVALLADPVFVDVGALLADGLPEPVPPAFLKRKDGNALFYAGKVNVLFGDPESGKTWIAYAALVEALHSGHKGMIVDVDHNGAGEIIGRLILLGANPETLADPGRFRLAEPEEMDELLRAVAAAKAWCPDVYVVDSIGEVLPMLRLSSNSPDDYSTGHRLVLSAVAAGGACAIAIDHMPKDDDARSHGQTGTMAKRRAVNGVTLKVVVHESFVPGRGGSASLSVHKDRPGGVREHCPKASGKSQMAGRFVMDAGADGRVRWWVTEPTDAVSGTESRSVASPAALAELDALDPPPRSQRDVKERLGWGSNRAAAALREWSALRSVPDED